MGRRAVGLLLVGLLALLPACTDRTPRSVATAPPSGSASAPDLGSAIDEFVTTRSGPWVSTRAVLVSHRGALVAERYYFSEAEEHADVFSVTKSVTATLVGMALADGSLDDLDQTLGELLPRQRAVMHEQTRRTTLRHLLTMTSGHTWDQVDPIDPSRPGYVRTLLRLRPEHALGSGVSYNDGGPHLLSAVLRERTGVFPLRYAREKLFGPLGIDTRGAYQGRLRSDGGGDRFAWLTDGDGLSGGGYGLRLTARDLVALGELYRNGGVWQGRRLLGADFVRQATRRQAELPDGDEGTGYGYGYLWWVTPLAGTEAYSAVGAYGQLLLVVPERELVVVISSRPSGQPAEPVDQLAMVEHVVLPRLG